MSEAIGPSNVAHESLQVPHVVQELDCLLAAIRLLVRACERRRLHRQMHALQLSCELMLRRRNYILNVQLLLPGGSEEAPAYNSFPCENCYFTYPTVHVMSWLAYILRSATDGLTIDPPSHLLCNQSCALTFGTPPLADIAAEGALYQLGAPFVAGPRAAPPEIVRETSESAEIEYVREALLFVLKSLSPDGATDGSTKEEIVTAERDLVECISRLLDCRRHFGFDMDCVHDPHIELCRAQLSSCLQSYESRLVSDMFHRTC